MNTLLVIAENPGATEVARTSANSGEWRVVHRSDLALCEPLLVHGLVQVCLLDTEPGVQAIWMLEQIHKWAPACPVIVSSSEPSPEWTEEAYLKGAFQVLSRPLRGRLLSEVLQRLPRMHETAPTEDTSFEVIGAGTPEPTPPNAVAGAQGLGLLRAFSGILTHSLDPDALLRQFLLFVRELFGLNRAVIFLAEDPTRLTSKRLRAASSLGVSQKLLGTIELSFDGGIGLLVSRSGRIVRRNSSQLGAVPDARREFEVLGAEVAVPIPDRENIIGIALLDARITGESLTNAELELLFHLLEQLGLGLRNISLHQQLASNSRMLSDVLRELSSACIVVDRDLRILHANQTSYKYFPPTTDNRAKDFGFDDLPPELGSRVYQVLHTGTALINHRHEAKGNKVYKISIVPFQCRQDGSVASVLLMAEDLTQVEQLRRLEVEAAELRLIRPMADRLSSEIGNAIVPIPVFAQLLNERHSEAAFRATMQDGLMEAGRRIERLVNQMRFLIGDIKTADQPFQLSTLLDESYGEALKHQPATRNPKFKSQTNGEEFEIQGDRNMLKLALTEILLNALQSSKNDASIAVRASRDSENSALVRIEIQDNGEGFTPDAARRATEPFYTTKTVGVGLGLTVSRRVLEEHGGRIEIPAPAKGKPGLVTVFLPSSKGQDKKKR